VADVVDIEPVSGPKFHANREKNRKFSIIGALGAPEPANNGFVTGLPMRIPYATEQGIISVEQRILVDVEPVSSPKFPANRENNREFCIIGASEAPEVVNNGVVIGLPMRIHYSTEPGIILEEQGIWTAPSGVNREFGP
jgi:hypothetical protein